MSDIKGIPKVFVFDTEKYGRIKVTATPNDIVKNSLPKGTFGGAGVLSVREQTLVKVYKQETVSLHESRILESNGYLSFKYVGDYYETGEGKEPADVTNYEAVIPYLDDQIFEGKVKFADKEEMQDLWFAIQKYRVGYFKSMPIGE